MPGVLYLTANTDIVAYLRSFSLMVGEVARYVFSRIILARWICMLTRICHLPPAVGWVAARVSPVTF